MQQLRNVIGSIFSRRTTITQQGQVRREDVVSDVAREHMSGRPREFGEWVKQHPEILESIRSEKLK